MANAKKCDRCSRYYDRNLTKTHGRIRGGTIIGIATVDKDHYYDNCYDLCDECIEKLQIFLSNSEEDQHGSGDC